MNGHPRDQAKVSVHDRWPHIRGTGGGVKRNKLHDYIASDVTVMFAIVIERKIIRHTAVEVYIYIYYCTVREQRIQRKSTFGASCACRISYQAGRLNFSRPRWQLSLFRYMLFSFFRTSWQLDNNRSISIEFTRCTPASEAPPFTDQN